MITLTAKIETQYRLLYDYFLTESSESTYPMNHIFWMFSYSFEIWINTVGWGPESINVFRIQKVIRVLGKVGRQVCCRNLFRDLNALPLPCLSVYK